MTFHARVQGAVLEGGRGPLREGLLSWSRKGGGVSEVRRWRTVQAQTAWGQGAGPCRVLQRGGESFKDVPVSPGHGTW